MRRFFHEGRDIAENLPIAEGNFYARADVHFAGEFFGDRVIEFLANRHFQSHARDQRRRWIFGSHDQPATCPIRFAPASSKRVASAIFEANAFNMNFGPIAFASSATRSTGAETERNCAPESRTNWHAVVTSRFSNKLKSTNT